MIINIFFLQKSVSENLVSNQDHIVTMNERGGGAQKRQYKKGKATNGSSVNLKRSLKSHKMEIEDRESLVIWKRPLTTIHYFIMELLWTLRDYLVK